MEMPINVMIILFVAIVVGIALIGFADNMLERSRDDLRELGPGEEGNLEDKIVPTTINEQTVSNLAGQCVRDKIATLDPELCFVLRGDSDISSVQGLDGQEFTESDRNWTYNIDITGNPTTVLMYFNPMGSVDIMS